MLYGLKRPCANCPFKPVPYFHLRAGRRAEIAQGLLNDRPFACHKTAGQGRAKKKEQHCAGAMIVLLKMQRPHLAMQLGERLGVIDLSGIDLQAPVYSDLAEFVGDQREDN